MPKLVFPPCGQEIKNLFSKDVPVNTIVGLLQKSGLGIRTLRRRMSECNVISSYNANSSFYTLPFFTKFNSYGLWHYGDASFSARGSLSATIKHMVGISAAGYSAGELSEVLRVKSDDFLRILSLKREIGKARLTSRNIYVSVDKNTSHKQISARKSSSPKVQLKKLALPRHKDQIAILTEIILTDNLSVFAEDIWRRLNKKGYKLNLEQVKGVINHYGFKKNP